MHFVVVLEQLIVCCAEQSLAKGKAASKSAVIDDISDVKELKKLFRTKNNVLVMFVSSIREAQSSVKTFREAADSIKGLGTMVLIDCSNGYRVI